MPDHERYVRPLLLRECQKLRRIVVQNIAIECYQIFYRETVEDREQQQRVFRNFSKRFSLVDQQTRSLRSRLSFRCCVPFGCPGSL